MKIDLHIHSNHSDGAMCVEDIFREATKRSIDMMSVTDHDTVLGQSRAILLAKKNNIRYVTGIELNITFSKPELNAGRNISLDLLGYSFDPQNQAMITKINQMATHRIKRAEEIMTKVNIEFEKEGIAPFDESDMKNIQESVDGTFGRPHIANYLVTKGIVTSMQDAFDKYLVKCDVPKFPLFIEEAAGLIHDAGGYAILAHPNDSHGTSLIRATEDLTEQTQIIEDNMLDSIDGVECWHTRHDAKTSQHYLTFAKAHDLMVTGGSDCHQKPIVMGSVSVPDFVADQFKTQ